MRQKYFAVSALAVALLFTQNGKDSRRGKVPGFQPSPQRLHHLPTLSRVPSQRRETTPYAADRILVKFKPLLTTQSIEATTAAYGARLIKKIPRIDVYVIAVPEDSHVEEMLYLMGQNQYVEHVGPDYIARVAVTPNDTFFSDQYALFNSGQELPVPGSPSGKARADISATAAWEETKGDADIIIAVIDTGIDFDHPDLKNKVISRGKDFVNDDDDAVDDNWHGTFVSAIAAAETNNSEGIAGVAWNCMILPVKSMDEEGEGFYSWVIDGIIWAVDNGASVINLSLGGDQPDVNLEAAVEYARLNGVVVVSAVGNDDSFVYYPAAYDNYVLAVAATDYNDVRPEWSNPGPEVDVAAPGELVISAVPTWFFGPGSLPYALGGGTSFSCPHVTGLAALLISHKPWLSVDEIIKIIRYTADDVNSEELPGQDDNIGYGRINMETALVPIQIKN